ncbi:biotin transporter BioY [Candidatus Babeliales bacterium]|nr:biotin transporter BioY [Candidatus Babeliales bacterium]
MKVLQLHKTKKSKIVLSFLLSWIFGLCAWISIPISFSLVPLYLHPLPIFLAVYIFDDLAVWAWFLYMTQGALGAPFFSCGRSGMLHLLGPTGGYVFGIFLGSLFLLYSKKLKSNSLILSGLKFAVASLFMHLFGALQLYFFVSSDKLLAVGFYPFIVSDFIIKLSVFVFINKFILSSHKK